MARTSSRWKAVGLTVGAAFLAGAGVGAAGAPAAVSAAAPRHKVTPPKLPAVCPNAGLAPTPSNLVAINRATVCLINKERVARGLVALAENPRLDRAASVHSQDMVAKNFFNDVGPGGQTVQQRALAAGYARVGWTYRVGENVAIGTDGADTPSEIVAGWMNQPAHRAVILRRFYRETGLGVATAIPRGYLNGRPGATYTQTFGVISPSRGT